MTSDTRARSDPATSGSAGPAAAALTPQVLAIIGAVYTGRHRARAFGACGLNLGLAGVFGAAHRRRPEQRGRRRLDGRSEIDAVRFTAPLEPEDRSCLPHDLPQ